MCVNPNDPVFYVYVYLDPRKPGNYVYGEYEFDYEPFYIGKGCNGRAYIHLKGNGYNKFFDRKIKKIQRVCKCDPIIIKYKEILMEQSSLDLEIKMIATIGRHDLKLGPLCNLTDGGDGFYNLSEDVEKKRCNGIKKMWLNDKYKERMRQKQIESQNKSEVKEKLRLLSKEIQNRPEISENKSKKQKELWANEIYRAKRKELMKNKISPLSKSIVCIETGQIFTNITEAQKYIGVKGHGNISACCRGKRNICGGYHWSYVY